MYSMIPSYRKIGIFAKRSPKATIGIEVLKLEISFEPVCLFLIIQMRMTGVLHIAM